MKKSPGGYREQPYTPRFWSRLTRPASFLGDPAAHRGLPTMLESCVTITTVVPVRLIRSSSFLHDSHAGRGVEVSGRLVRRAAPEEPVDERPRDRDPLLLPAGQARRGGGSPLAIEADQAEHFGDDLGDGMPRLPDDVEGEGDVLSATVLFSAAAGSPGTRCRPGGAAGAGTLRRESRRRSLPATQMSPLVGCSSFSTSRRNVDFPDPDCPTRKRNSPLSTSTLMSSSAGRVLVG